MTNPRPDQAALNDAKARLLQAASSGDLEGMARAIADGADPKEDHSFALSLAASRGRSVSIRFLLPLSDPEADRSLSLRNAIRSGNPEAMTPPLPFAGGLGPDAKAAMIGCAISQPLAQSKALLEALLSSDRIEASEGDFLLSLLSLRWQLRAENAWKRSSPAVSYLLCVSNLILDRAAPSLPILRKALINADEQAFPLLLSRARDEDVEALLSDKLWSRADPPDRCLWLSLEAEASRRSLSRSIRSDLPSARSGRSL